MQLFAVGIFSPGSVVWQLKVATTVLILVSLCCLSVSWSPFPGLSGVWSQFSGLENSFPRHSDAGVSRCAGWGVGESLSCCIFIYEFSEVPWTVFVFLVLLEADVYINCKFCQRLLRCFRLYK